EVRRLHESRSAARRHEKPGPREPPPELRDKRVLRVIAGYGMAAHHADDLRRATAVAFEPRGQRAVDAEVMQPLGDGLRRGRWVAAARGKEVAGDPATVGTLRVRRCVTPDERARWGGGP